MVSCKEKETPDETPASDPSVVVYECNERLFAQTKAFQTIEAYVPELERMQVNVLWLMPIHPRGTKNSVGSPYCIQDHLAIDPAFGTMDDLKSLVNTCHSHHIRVILDWVANHTAWDNAWVSAHPEWFQEAQTDDERMWKDVTFLDYSQQAVRDTMKACMLYWIHEADIDGFRCDHAHGVPTDWWKDVNAAILQAKPTAFLLAETQNAGLYSAGFQLIYSWSYLTSIENLYSGKGTIKGLISIHNSEMRNTPEGRARLRYVTTHDECSEKAPSSVYTNAAGELSAFCLTIFMGGVPMIYSSQELGHMNKINFFDYNILRFTSSNPAHDALVTLMQAYQNTRDLRLGTQQTGALTDKVAYVEYTRDEHSLLVVCNTTNSAQTAPLPDAYHGVELKEVLSNEKVTLESSVTLPAFAYRIFQK